MASSKDYQEKVMKVKATDKDTLYFDHYNPADLQPILGTLHKVVLQMKTKFT
jgi:hypothetical protein